MDAQRPVCPRWAGRGPYAHRSGSGAAPPQLRGVVDGTLGVCCARAGPIGVIEDDEERVAFGAELMPPCRAQTVARNVSCTANVSA